MPLVYQYGISRMLKHRGKVADGSVLSEPVECEGDNTSLQAIQVDSCHHRCVKTWSIVVLAVGSRFVIPDIMFCFSEPSSFPQRSSLSLGCSLTASSAISDAPLKALHQFSLLNCLRSASEMGPK